MNDYRYNPFSDALEPVPITGETHIIPSNSPYTIRLKEVPVKDSPSTVTLTIAGVAGVEVAAEPAAGQFRCDYTTSADSDDNWNTGLIQFNAADAGKTVVAAYNGMGTLVSADFHGFQMFNTVGTFTFTVPKGVNKVYISGCGGGGAGNSGASYADSLQFARGGGAGAECAVKTPLTAIPGQSYTITVGNGGAPNQGAGGASSFGALLTLKGGGGANGDYGGVSGGFGGQNGGVGGLRDIEANQGKGGSSIFGVGGVLTARYTLGVNGSGYGAGGSSGGGHNLKGGAGSQGFILVEW